MIKQNWKCRRIHFEFPREKTPAVLAVHGKLLDECSMYYTLEAGPTWAVLLVDELYADEFLSKLQAALS